MASCGGGDLKSQIQLSQQGEVVAPSEALVGEDCREDFLSREWSKMQGQHLMLFGTLWRAFFLVCVSALWRELQGVGTKAWQLRALLRTVQRIQGRATAW